MKAAASYDSDDAAGAFPRGRPADPGRLWLSARRDWRWIPVGGLIWGALGLCVAFVLIKDTFRSDAVLVWEPKTEQRPDEHQLTAEVQRLKAPSALSQLRQRLGLTLPLEVLARQVDLRFDAHSGLVVLMADGASPQDAMRLCHTLIEVFVEQQRDFAKVRARAAIAILQRDAAVARARLDRARKTYETFRTESGVPDIAAEQRSALETLTRLKEKALTRSDAGVRGAHAAAPTPPVRAPETAAARDTRRLEELRAELAAMRARSPENSRIPALEAQIAALRGRSAHKLAADTTTADPAPAPGSPHSTLWQFLSGEKAPSSEAAGRRGKEPPDALQAAQQRVTALAAMERAGQPLRADLEAAQSQLAGLEEALARAQDALETPHDDWRLLTPAVKPARPERANQSLIAAGMPLAGMLVALLVLLLRPILDARVYTAREAAYWAGLPVIASSGWPRNREMFFSLVDELGQQAVGASGYTLLVGATGAEKALAEDLAYWLGGGPVGSRRGGGSAAAYTEAAATTVVTTPHQSPLGAPEVIATSAGPSVKPSETLVIVERKPVAPLGIHPKGTHAWLGEVEGPALRRAARVADRVIVLLGSGTLTFTAVGALRTRLGRNSGVALIVLGLSPKLLELPDQAGDIGQFWHRLRRPGAAM